MIVSLCPYHRGPDLPVAPPPSSLVRSLRYCGKLASHTSSENVSFLPNGKFFVSAQSVCGRAFKTLPLGTVDVVTDRLDLQPSFATHYYRGIVCCTVRQDDHRTQCRRYRRTSGLVDTAVVARTPKYEHPFRSTAGRQC